MRVMYLAIFFALSAPAYALPSKTGQTATQLSKPVANTLPFDTQQPNAICAECESDPPDTGGGGGGGGGGSTPPQPAGMKVIQHKVNPDQKTVEIAFDNGIVMVVDEALGKVFIATPTSSTEMSLDSALLQMANGNVQSAAALKAELHALLSDPMSLSQLSKEGVVGSSLNAENSSLAIENDGPSATAISGVDPGSGDSMMAGAGYPGFNCMFEINCQYKPQYVDFGSGGGGGGWYGFGYVDDVIGGGGDYQRWKDRRDAACQAARENFQDAGLATGFMAGGCAAAASGVGLGVCAISGLAVIVFMNRAANNSQTCSSPYPGPG